MNEVTNITASLHNLVALWHALGDMADAHDYGGTDHILSQIDQELDLLLLDVGRVSL